MAKKNDIFDMSGELEAVQVPKIEEQRPVATGSVTRLGVNVNQQTYQDVQLACVKLGVNRQQFMTACLELGLANPDLLAKMIK